jgi:tetratricopeptide (TPR) repeat protein
VLALHRATHNNAGQADALNAMGWCHAQLLNYQGAVQCCTQALTLQQQLDNAIGEAHTWDTLGYAHHHLKSYPKAIACYQSALAIFTDLDNSYYQATVLTHLGETHLATGDADAAQTSWVLARRILHNLNHPEESDVDAKLHGLTSPKCN